MFTGSIPISQLDQLGAIVSTDFFPLDQSSSLTTFRVSIATLNDWFMFSGSCFSASWASASISSSYALSASYALLCTSASYAFLCTSASYALSASAALMAFSASYGLTASYALNSTSASWSPIPNLVPSASYAISTSLAAASISASYALSASYAPALADTVPIGTIMAFGGTSAPNNWVECNGAALSTASFSQLYAAIQNTSPSASFGFLCDQFGNPNAGGAFFKVPDLRGEFLRGWDDGRGVDVGRILASFQAGAVQAHKHISPMGEHSPTGPFGIGGSPNNFGSAGGLDNDNYWYFTNDGTAVGTANPNNPGVISTETRPRNVAIMYCIKYGNVTNFATTGISLAGDVIGSSSATLVTAIRGTGVSTTPPTQGQVMLYNTSSGWTPTTIASNGMVAWATIIIPTASNYSSDNINVVNNGNNVNKPYVLNGFNVADASWTAQTINPDANFMGNRPLGRTNAQSTHNLLITMTNPSPTTNYMIVGTCFEQGQEYGAITFYPWQTRTTTQFTMSFGGGPDFSGGAEYEYITFVIYAS